jgi:hypothetical protein
MDGEALRTHTVSIDRDVAEEIAWYLWHHDGRLFDRLPMQLREYVTDRWNREHGEKQRCD